MAAAGGGAGDGLIEQAPPDGEAVVLVLAVVDAGAGNVAERVAGHGEGAEKSTTADTVPAAIRRFSG
ncbi:hypothetical protein B9W62_27460 [Streptomyces sp. CS113]|nr:hypothetical protein B9W62_27460 [Streptomyces sp. CS113]